MEDVRSQAIEPDLIEPDLEAMAAKIQDWCVSYLSKSLNRPTKLIDPNAKLTRLGVDSASSVFFLMDLEEWLAVELPPNVVFEHPTIARLARYVAKHYYNEAARGRG
jgi:acyl carrier protein